MDKTKELYTVGNKKEPLITIQENIDGMTKNSCFFGHSQLADKEAITMVIFKKIQSLITGKLNVIIFGGYGCLDILGRMAVNALKVLYPHIKTVYVQAYCKPSDSDIEDLKRAYDEVIYPENKGKSGGIRYNPPYSKYGSFCIFYVS